MDREEFRADSVGKKVNLHLLCFGTFGDMPQDCSEETAARTNNVSSRMMQQCVVNHSRLEKLFFRVPSIFQPTKSSFLEREKEEEDRLAAPSPSPTKQ